VEDHLHIVTDLHPSVPLADLVKDIKLSTTKLIKEGNIFPEFGGWQDGYGGFTYHIDAKNNLIEYVKNQEEHHRIITFEDEFRKLLKEHMIEFDDKFLL
jgi:putative transposase